MIANNAKEVRWVVRIVFNYYTQFYFKNDMTNEFFNKWRWYFEYRAALLKVQNPKAVVTLEVGAYDFVLPLVLYHKRLKNLISKKKGQLSSLRSKLDYAINNWDELFSIFDHPLYIKVQQKIDKISKEYDALVSELEESLAKPVIQAEQPKFCINPSISTGL